MTEPHAVNAKLMSFQNRSYAKLSFFEHLNYDIRQIIYQFMEDHLPPVSHSLEYIGFALSCKQAFREVRQPAVKGLRRFLEDFQRNFERYAATSISVIPDIQLHGTFASVQHMTICVPPSLVMSSFDMQLDKTVVALRPILSGHFRKVTFLFVDAEKEYPPNFRTGMRISSAFALFRLSQIIMDERKVQSSIKELSKFISLLSKQHDVHPPTCVQSTRREFDITEALLHDGKDLPKPIRTMDIQIAWDWREESTRRTSATLRGNLHEYTNDALSRDQSAYPRLYVLENEDKTAGMQGMVCKERWSISESIRMYWLLQEQRYKSSRGYCWSEGIGKEVQQGLGGISVKEYQDNNPPLVLAALA